MSSLVIKTLLDTVITFSGMGGTCRYISTPLHPRTPNVRARTANNNHHTFLYSPMLGFLRCIRAISKQHIVLDTDVLRKMILNFVLGSLQVNTTAIAIFR